MGKLMYLMQRIHATCLAILAIALIFMPTPSLAADGMQATSSEGQTILIKPYAKLYYRSELNSQSAGLFSDLEGASVLGLKGEWYLVRQAGRRILYLHKSEVTQTGRQPRAPAPKQASEPQPGYQSEHYSDPGFAIGAGGFVDTINRSVGPTIIVKPWGNLTLQASAGIGEYETIEARAYLSSDITTWTTGYFGLCYLHAKTETEVYGIDVQASGSGAGIVMGFEHRITDAASIYLDFSYTPLDLEATATIGPLSVKEETGYSPTRVGLGLVYYLVH